MSEQNSIQSQSQYEFRRNQDWENISIGKECAISFKYLENKILQVEVFGKLTGVNFYRYTTERNKILDEIKPTRPILESIDIKQTVGTIRTLVHHIHHHRHQSKSIIGFNIINTSIFARLAFKITRSFSKDDVRIHFHESIDEVLLELPYHLNEKPLYTKGKEYICPPEWKYFNSTSLFEAQFSIIDKNILISEHSGELSAKDIPHISKIIADIFQSGKLKPEYIKVADYTKTDHAPWKARMLYAKTLNTLHANFNFKPELSYICGANPIIKTTLLFAQSVVKQKFIFKNTITEAIQDIYQDSPTIRLEKDSKITINKSEIDILIKKIGSIAWRDDNHIETPDNITPEIQVLYNAIDVMRTDFNSIIRERDASLKLAKKEALKAKEANSVKANFLTNISHEIRTPLNAIIGLGRILQNKIDDTSLQNNIETILKSGEALLVLINDILDISKIENGQIKLEIKQINLEPYLSQIIRVFAHNAETKGLTLNVNIDKNFEGDIFIDEVRLRQVLFNLIGNAIKFTNKGAINIDIFCIKSSETTASLKCTVEDSGIGIPESEYENIFTTFRQHKQNDKHNFSGTGLGLAITKKLIEKMGGQISVTSELGKGSCFLINIPKLLIKENVKHSKTKDIKQNQLDLSSKKTLILCDNIWEEDLIKTEIDQFKTQVFTAVSIEQLTQLSTIYFPELIIIVDNTHTKKTNETILSIQDQLQCKLFVLTQATELQFPPKDDVFETVNYSNNLELLSENITTAFSTIKEEPQEISTSVPEENIEAFISELENSIWGYYNTIKDNISTNDLEEFKKLLFKASMNNPVKLIDNYCSDIDTALNLFDIEKMEALMKDFPTLIDNLKKNIRNK